MFKRGLSAVMVLAVASIANASAVVTLSPSTRTLDLDVDTDPAAYTFDVAVGVSQDPGGTDRLLRLAILDFTTSNSGISLNSFAFDFSSVPFGGALYAPFPDLPVPQAAYSSTSPQPLGQWVLPADGSTLTLGTLNITIPMAEGVYDLSALGPMSNIGYGFGVEVGDDIVELIPGDGLGGGAATFTVVPEPATLAFLAIGGLAMLRRRIAK